MEQKIKIREFLFNGFDGCTNHGCIVTGPKKGIGTNGMCDCLTSMQKSRLYILKSRIEQIADLELPEQPKGAE